MDRIHADDWRTVCHLISRPQIHATQSSMTERKKLIETSSREEYLHKETWRVVPRQLMYAESNPIGATYDDLVAMVFAFHTLEGYLNYLGEKIAPDLWRDEREQFADSGFKGKLSSICERCALESPDFGTRPYGTLLELKKLRNAMAHPRTRKTSSKKEYDERKSPPMFHPTYLEQFVTHNKALRAHDDVKSIVTQIHAAALAKFRRSTSIRTLSKASQASLLSRFLTFRSDRSLFL
jgi:hypothetical protein